MTFPLMFLALASIVAGFVPFHDLITSDGKSFETHLNYSIAIPSVAIAVLGMFIAFLLYYKESKVPDKISKSPWLNIYSLCW